VLARHAGEVPTAEVHGVATAIAAATELNLQGCTTLHLVDDHLPHQAEYLAALRRRGQLPRARLALPAGVLGVLARSLRLLSGSARKPPEITAPQSFAGRLRPYRFSNQAAKRVLGWQPAHRFT
jgi:hypothetical protein